MAALTTVRLADRPDLVQVLAGWYEKVWAPYYGPSGPGDATADLNRCDGRADLPICLVALDPRGKPVGTAALKSESVASPPDTGPWLAALVADPDRSLPGIEEFLTAAIEAEARRLGYPSLYTGWDPGARLLLDRGWIEIDQAESLRGEMSIYRLDLAGS